MASWLHALKKTRRKIGSALGTVLGGGALDEDEREDLEAILLSADVAPAVVQDILDTLDRGGQPPLESVRQTLLSELRAPDPEAAWRRVDRRPRTILVVGVNGSGKTTTCAKLAHRFQRQGHQPLLAAADTFRAAGSDQLQLWADRVGCRAVGGRMGADAASVVYDAASAAEARGADPLLIDTAGRMHTKKPLMQELDKMRRALGKRLEGAPDETWIVLDASIGQNAVHQARFFHEVVPLTGVIVSKLDGSAKAGFLFSISRELGIPVLYAGLGEGEEDLVPFDPEAFVNSLLGLSAEREMKA